MATPHASASFGDLLDPRFQEIFDDVLPQLPDMLSMFYTMVPSNGRDTIRWSEVGTMVDWSQFSGSVTFNSVNQGFDAVLTPLEFTSGFQVERKLFDDDQYHVMDQRPKGLATSLVRTRQKHGARPFTNGFSVDNFFMNNSEAVAIFSNSHTTNSGASTANGFDNLATAAMSATAVASGRIQMKGFRGDQAERFNVRSDTIIHPVDLFEQAWEIVNAYGKLDTAENNPNVHKGVYNLIEWDYLTDSNDWWMADSALMKQHLFWSDRVAAEFAFAEELDNLIAKWRGYVRYGAGHINWRWGLGHQVS